MNFVQNILWNSIEGFVEAGTRTAGGYAGDALLKAGDLIEGAGRSVGNGIERTASSYGTKLSSGAPAPTTAKKPAVKRSHSSPASSKPLSTASNKTASTPATRGPTSKVPLGASKYPGGKSTAGVVKQITSGAKSSTGGATKSSINSATKALSGAGGAQKALTSGATKALGTTAGTTKKPLSNPLPKPYPNAASTALPKPNNASSFPSTNSSEKKTPVRPNGPPKPFNPPGAKNATPGAKIGGDVKPYPGTNTLPGQGSRTPVRKQKYKPLPRMEGTAERGKATFF